MHKVPVQGAVLIRKFTFRGGVHPSSNKKQTESIAIQPFPAPSRVIIPLKQHPGSPAQPLVKRGDRVLTGQCIGEAGSANSANVHSSVSGSVLSVGLFPHTSGKQVLAIEIENDGLDETAPFSPYDGSWRDAAPGELVQKIQAAGVVGMGGESFPTHIKLSPPSNKTIDTLIINGTECEPYITSDYRLMVERTEDLLTGILLFKKILGVKNCFLGITEDKSDLLQSISKIFSNQKFKDITLGYLKQKYPQGSEKQLIQSFTMREVPDGGTPIDAGCIVHNPGTVLTAYDAVVSGIPLYQRVVTVSGPTIKKPGIFLVRIGTPIRSLLEYCEIEFKRTKKIIAGGPMMGSAQSDLDAPVIKSTTGLVGIDFVQPAVRTYPCINCGHCLHACPVNLQPSKLVKFVEKGKFTEAVNYDLMSCIECGSCSYVCPAKINIVHFIRLGKFHEQKNNETQSKQM